MDYFELYKARMQANGSNITNSQSNVTQDIINNSFKDSPSYKLSRIDNTEVDIRVIKGIKSNTKKVLFRPQYKTNIGKIIEFNNKKWLIVDFENDDIFPYASVQLCSNTLKWKNEIGIVIEYPMIIGNLTLYSDGLDTSRYTTTENGKRTINLPYNEVTKKLYIGQRFVINSDSVFAISHIDNFSIPGLLTLTMIQSQERSNDDFMNNLADNSAPTITISLQTTNKELILNDTYQLTPIVTKDTISFDAELIYESTHTNVATVNSTGLITSIALGNCTIKAKLKDNPTIESLININVIASNQDVYSVDIVGNDTIKKLSTNIYTATVYRNGVAVVNNVVWNVMGDINKIEIVSESATDISIKALDGVGTIEIHAIRQDHSESAHKTVTLKSLW